MHGSNYLSHFSMSEKRGNEEREHRNKAILEQLNIGPFLGKAHAFDAAILDLISKLALTPELSRTSIRLYVALAGKMNRRTGFCYPGVSSLAEILGVSSQAIRRACRELESSGFIHVEQNASTYRTNLFFIDFRRLRTSDSNSGIRPGTTGSETGLSGSLDREIFGETNVAGLSTQDQELLRYAAERKWSHD